MKKFIASIAGVLFAAALFGGIYFYLQKQDKDYDSLMKRAEKKQRDHSEFIDFYGEREPSIPSGDENSKTLLGVDANVNGVRDDIDVWINRSALTQNETLAMRQYAKARQEWLRVCDGLVVSDVKVAKKRLEDADRCLTALSDYKRRENGYARGKLELLVLNTDSRRGCAEFFVVNDSVTPISVGGEKNFSCEFEIQYPENVVSGNDEWKKKR